MKAQTDMYRRWQSFLRSLRRDPLARDHHQPARLAELYPAEIDGKPTRTYFHWLALAYYPSLAGHPALCLPVGLDRNGMPFGLQIVGPRGGDASCCRSRPRLSGTGRRRADPPPGAGPGQAAHRAG